MLGTYQRTVKDQTTQIAEPRTEHMKVLSFTRTQQPAEPAGSKSIESAESGGVSRRADNPSTTMEQKLRGAQEILDAGRATLLTLAEDLSNLCPDLEETSTKVAKIKKSRDHLRNEAERTKAEAKQFSARLREREAALEALRKENAINEFRARHRKRERDAYRAALHGVRYFLFKPSLLRRMKAERQEKKEIIQKSGLFDFSWYLKQYPGAESDPINHYLWEGALIGADPLPLFDTDWYLAEYAGARKKGENPLVHYLTEGWKKQFSPHPWFDSRWYLKQYPEVASRQIEPLLHFLSQGWKENKRPHPNFDIAWYKLEYSNLLGDNSNPLVHFVTNENHVRVLPQKNAHSQRGLTVTFQKKERNLDEIAKLHSHIAQLETALQKQQLEMDRRFQEIAALTRYIELKSIFGKGRPSTERAD